MRCYRKKNLGCLSVPISSEGRVQIIKMTCFLYSHIAASRFGMMQIKTGLATVIRNFEFTPSTKTETPLKLTPRLILTNCAEVWLKCKKREFDT